MKRNWIVMAVIAGGLGSTMFGQQYPQQYPPNQGNPNYNGQYDNGQYNNGQYNNGQYDNGQYDNGQYDNGQYDNGGYQGVYAPAPPPIPNYAYQRPPMPGPHTFPQT